MRGILTTTLLTLFILGSHAQTQQKYWFMNGYKVTFPLPGSTSTPTYETLPATDTYNLQGQGIYDDQGNVVFYINGKTIYEPDGDVISGFPYNGSKQVTDYASGIHVVPCIDGINRCTGIYMYYIFYFITYPSQSSSRAKDLYAKILTYNSNNQSYSIVDVVTTGNEKVNLATPPYNDLNNNGHLAVSKVLNGVRYLYVVGGYGIYKIVLSSESGNGSGISGPSLIYNRIGNDYHILNGNSEFEISPDGSKLACMGNYYWDETQQDGGHLRLQVWDLNSSGDLVSGGYRNEILWSSYANDHSRTFGIEFSSTSDSLYYSTSTSIYVKDLSNITNSSVAISGSQYFTNSVIEMGYDGYFYATGSDNYLSGGNKIRGINPSTNAFSKLIDLHRSYLIAELTTQIDGEDYYQTSPGGYDVTNLTVSSSATWTPTTLPFLHVYKNGRVRVGGTITVASGATLYLDGAVLDFGPSGKIVVNNGGELKTKNATLESSCDKLWPGISIGQGWFPPNYNRAKVTDISTTRTIIRDAIIGIKSTGFYSEIDFSGSTEVKFIANLGDINLLWGDGQYMKISNCIMDGLTPLKDQSFGSSNGWADGLKRGITSISWNLVNGVTYFDNVYLSGYQTGVSVIGSDIDIQDGGLASTILYGINASQMNSTRGQSLISIKNCQLINSKVLVKDGYNLELLKSSFSATNSSAKGYFVEWRNNKGKILAIGDGTTDNKNTFSTTTIGYNVGGIRLYDNADETNTEILIQQNDFSNINYPGSSAVLIEEAPSMGSPSYKVLRVHSNNMTNVNRGIRTTNVVGRNTSSNNTLEALQLAGFDNSEIYSNTITYASVNDQQAYGIQTINGGSLSIINNNITYIGTEDNVVGDKYGIYVATQPDMLVGGNVCSKEMGLRGDGYMINSNYYCNTFNSCASGIYLNPTHRLRSSGQLHGVPNPASNNSSRNNIFIATKGWGWDINSYTYYINENQWVLKSGTKIPKTTVNNRQLFSAQQASNSYCDIPLGYAPGEPELNKEFANYSDPISNWRAQYYNEGLFRNELNDSGATDSDIVTLYNIEELLQANSFEDAKVSLSNWTPSSQIATEYKIVYSIYSNANLRYQDVLLMLDTTQLDTLNPILDHVVYTQSEIDSLHTVALLDPVTESPASYNARAILSTEYDSLYFNSDGLMEPNIAGYAGQYCEDTLSDIEVKLEEQGSSLYVNYSVRTDENGLFTFDPDSLMPLISPSLSYRIVAEVPSETKYTMWKTIEQLIYSSNHFLGCTLDKTGGKNPVLEEAIEQLGEAMSQNSVFPNPGSGALKLRLKSDVAKVEVYDLFGRMVASTFADKLQLDVTNLANGIYTVNFVTKNGAMSGTKKLTILND